MITDSLYGKTALVTGASRGIGAEIARSLARQGALVACHYGASKDKAEAVLGQIESAGGRGFLVRADLRKPAQIAEMFEVLDRQFTARVGERTLDILVNNAGIGGAHPVSSATEADFDLLVDTNVKGTFFVMQNAIPRLRNEGRVVNLGSVVARGANGPRALYSMCKLTINGLTRSLAQELAPRRITVNAVNPGAVATDLSAKQREIPGFNEMVIAATAFGRYGETADIANAVLLLLQQEASWITAQVIEVSGGLRI